MPAFLAATLAAVVLAIVAAFVLSDFVQEPSAVAFSTSGVRLSDEGNG